MTIRIWTTSILTIGALALPGTAGAADSSLIPPLPPLPEADLAGSSLRLSDVPASFSKDPQIERSYVGPGKTRRYEMCVDTDGRKVFGRVPLQHQNSTVALSQTGSGNNLTAARVVSSDIYVYRSTKAAGSAWRKQQRDRARCAPRITKKVPFQGARIDIDVVQTQRELRRHAGSPGWSLEQDVSTEIAPDAGGLRIYVDGFTVYRRVGATVLRVQFANYDQESLRSVTLRPEWRRFSRATARTMVDRLHRIAGQ